MVKTKYTSTAKKTIDGGSFSTKRIAGRPASAEASGTEADASAAELAGASTDEVPLFTAKDYECFIPEGLTGADRELVRQYLTKQEMPKSDEAINVLVNALLEPTLAGDGPNPEESGGILNAEDIVATLRDAGHFPVLKLKAGTTVRSGMVARKSASMAEPSPPSAIEVVVDPSEGDVAESSSSVVFQTNSAEGTAKQIKRKRIKERVWKPVEYGRGDSSGLASKTKNSTAEDQRRVDPALAAQIRKKVNVGWQSSCEDSDAVTDTNIADYCKSLGQELYNFVNYPIGGAKRDQWRLSSESRSPPPIFLPDLQLKNGLWETYVQGSLSSWIDCDSDDRHLAAISEKAAERELQYASYLGLSGVVVELRRTDNTRLAKVISKFLWTVKDHRMKFCAVVPTNKDLLIRKEGDERDSWETWADFRCACGNFWPVRLNCGLRLTEDLGDEFVDTNSILRWKAEALVAFLVDTRVFTTNPTTGLADLNHCHSMILESLWTSDTSYTLVRGPVHGNFAKVHYAQAIRSIIGPIWLSESIDRKPNFLDINHVQYADVLQSPLQPLSENLQSSVYNTFEADNIKYVKYGEAIEVAIIDMALKRKRDDFVLYVLGGGRGPLMSAAMSAEQRINEYSDEIYLMKEDGSRRYLRMRFVVVEKNPNALVTLQYLNHKLWQGRVAILECDMRDLAKKASRIGLPRPDIIVSELLGSWGDNELSPECLDGVTPWLKEDTISIPTEYRSYAQPIACNQVACAIRTANYSRWTKGYSTNGRELPTPQPDNSWEQHLREGMNVTVVDQLYVAYLVHHYQLADPQELFQFVHPNFNNTSNERSTEKEFVMRHTHEVMGFAGYFTAVLYKHVRYYTYLRAMVLLSTNPSTHTMDMLSWFPAILPLRDLVRVKKGDKLRLHLDRKVDEGGVWYEWFVEHEGAEGSKRQTERQNVGGEGYYMRLLAKDGDEEEEDDGDQAGGSGQNEEEEEGVPVAATPDDTQQ